ncbi:MAG TPA: flagellar assembly peptidoglycan hydrolase FlgJ [Burkholderiaceae bacterium]|nr:flagellar assembly peptidoglycan hydrolase FlgJ [Burkholderiaceae bacterium]
MKAGAALASDVRSLDALRTAAARDPQAAVKQAATQFEAMFMQLVLKSMRDATPKSGMFDGPGREMYEGMLDAQLAQTLAGRGGGLSEMIARQLSRHITDGEVPAVRRERIAAAINAGLGAATGAPSGAVTARIAPRHESEVAATPGAAAADSAAASKTAVPGLPAPQQLLSTKAGGAAFARAAQRAAQPTAAPAAVAQPSDGGSGDAAASRSPQREFIQRLRDAAQAAQQATGVPAAFILGQAALESGWGRHEPLHPDGSRSFNLFGIKAGSGWRGATVESPTTEYVDGQPVRMAERFRAYGSYEEAFADWARLIAGSPRYAAVLQSADSPERFAAGMQRAGYATDPNYARKLSRVIQAALAASLPPG